MPSNTAPYEEVSEVVKPKDVVMASFALTTEAVTDRIVREVKAGETSHQESPENHSRTVSRELIGTTITNPDTVKTTELPVVSPVLKENTEAATAVTAVEATVVTEVETTRDSEEATEEATVATAVATMAVKVVTRTLAPEVAVATEAEATATTTTLVVKSVMSRKKITAPKTLTTLYFQEAMIR